MRRFSLVKLILAGLIVVALAAASSPAVAAVRPVSCHTSFDARGAHCGTIRVPVDRSGKVAGTTQLFEELVPGNRPGGAPVVVFPGGPGLSASLVGRSLAAQFAPFVAGRDLIFFDQRGTGRSGFLDCDSALDPTYFVPAGLELLQEAKTVERCARSLGPRRDFYTTAETVADLEAMRSALGIDRLSLVGISYGTRDAMEYARAYPQHVESLVLDSVVADPGNEPEGVSSLRAVGRVLRQACAGGACAGITSDPAADLQRLVAKLQHGAIRPRRLLGRPGCHTRIPITRGKLWGVISEADFNPVLLSELPVAIAKAANGRPYQLSELIGEEYSYRLYDCLPPRRDKSDQDFKLPKDFKRYFRYVFSSGEQIARICEDTPMPWEDTTPVTDRRRLFENAMSRLTDAAFAPFDRATAMSNVLPPLCKYWPRARRGSAIAGGPLPPVPTLIVSGLDDLRTPTEDAVALAGANPAARLLMVPNQGHAALDSLCGKRALSAFLAARPVADCRATARHVPAPARKVKPYWD